MSSKRLVILSLVGLALLVLIFVSFNKNKTNAPVVPAATSTAEVVEEAINVLATTTENFQGTLNALPGSIDAPQQLKVNDEVKVPEGAVRLEVSDSGFNPKQFTVLAGQPVSLAVSASGPGAHVILFPDVSLMGLTMMINSGDTKIVNFIAPAPGEYLFRDDIPALRQNTGKMIVK